MKRNKENENKDKQVDKKANKPKRKSKFLLYIKAIFTIAILCFIGLIVVFYVWDSNTFNVYFEIKDDIETYENVRISVIKFPLIETKTDDDLVFYGWKDKETNKIYNEESILIKKETTFKALFINELLYENNLELEKSFYPYASGLVGLPLKQAFKDNYNKSFSDVSDLVKVRDSILNNNIYLLNFDNLYLPYENDDYDNYIKVNLINESFINKHSSEKQEAILNERYNTFYIHKDFVNIKYPINSSDGYEPPEEFRGLIARTILYMWLYFDAYDFTKSYNENDRLISLETVLRWHFNYPPNDFENFRNSQILIGVGASNPFSDYKEFATYLFKDDIIALGLEELIYERNWSNKY